jgi:hypothetical protein
VEQNTLSTPDLTLSALLEILKYLLLLGGFISLHLRYFIKESKLIPPVGLMTL